MSARKNKAVVTGGAGFVGAHTVSALLETGARVVVFDSLRSGGPALVPSGADFIAGDIRDAVALDAAMRDTDAIVHLAALISVPESIKHPEETRAVNEEGTERVFELALARGIRRVVYASSAAVYGNEPTLPKRESSVLVPESPYAISKIENERTAMRLATRGLSIAGLRFFNVYGPGQSADHPYASVVPRFVAFAREGEPLPLFGDGSQTRDFVHVSDVARAILKALHTRENGVFNIASGGETSLNELIALIREMRPVRIERHPPRSGDIVRSVADISLARRVLGFSPRIPLELGIRQLLS